GNDNPLQHYSGVTRLEELDRFVYIAYQQIHGANNGVVYLPLQLVLAQAKLKYKLLRLLFVNIKVLQRRANYGIGACWQTACQPRRAVHSYYYISGFTTYIHNHNRSRAVRRGQC